jgi:hypothetical protein
VHLIGKEDVVKLVKELVIGHFPFLPDSYEVDVLGHMTVIAKNWYVSQLMQQQKVLNTVAETAMWSLKYI